MRADNGSVWTVLFKRAFLRVRYLTNRMRQSVSMGVYFDQNIFLKDILCVLS